jgi:hypothetical protein
MQEEKKVQKDLYVPCLQNGDVVWAKMDGFPWWPAMVFYSQRILFDHNLPSPHLNPSFDVPVVCFLDSLEYAAVPKDNIVPFDSHDYIKLLRGSSKHIAKYKKKLTLAIERALEILHKVISPRAASFATDYLSHV